MKKRIAIVVTCGATLAMAGLHAKFAGSDVDLLASENQVLVSTIAFSSTRDDPANIPLLTGEIYLLNPDGTNARRVTVDGTYADFFPALSPDRKKIVFESNRLRAAGEPLNTSDLFVMNTDGTEQALLTRGSSATWSPDLKTIAYHASASGTGQPIRPDPGAPAADNDLFVLNVDDVLNNVSLPRNITESPFDIEEDANWSPDGQAIVFTGHPASDQPPAPVFHYTSKEIYVLNVDETGVPTGEPVQLTNNAVEERAPAWSPDGKRILFMCRIGAPTTPTATTPTFEICVMNADGPYDPEAWARLTDNNVGDFTATWSPDGQQIVFHRLVAGRAQLWVMNANGTAQTQLTNTMGLNLLANWGVLRVKVEGF
jgi:TolB protein